MATAEGAIRVGSPRRVALGWAFIERQTNLWKRYWAWELVWLVYLIGMSLFGVLHATLRTSLILACSLPFFSVSFAHASWTGVAAVVVVGSLSLVGLGILTGILPLLYPERGEQMSFMVQAIVLLV